MTHTGKCLCSAVTFEGNGHPTLTVCHCAMCRKWHGGPSIGVEFSDGVTLQTGEASLTWYESSPWAERGFCTHCGTSLFYRLKDQPHELHPQAGAFDLSPDLKIGEHIFVDEHPGYYAFGDMAPRLTGQEVIDRVQAENTAKGKS